MASWLAKVYVTLKPVVNDPQGISILGALHSLGFGDVTSVRAGKYLELKIGAVSREAASESVSEMARKLLANPVIEDFRFDLAELAD